MKQLRHTNVCELKNCFYSKGDKVSDGFNEPFNRECVDGFVGSQTRFISI